MVYLQPQNHFCSNFYINFYRAVRDCTDLYPPTVLCAGVMCWCDSGDTETYLHCFYSCTKNKEAAERLLRCAMVYDASLTAEKSLTLQVTADEVFMLATITILTTGLETIWANRQLKKVRGDHTFHDQSRA